MGGQNLPEAPEELTVEALSRRLRGIQNLDSVDKPRTADVKVKIKVDNSVTERLKDDVTRTTTTTADIHSPSEGHSANILKVEPQEKKKKVSIIDPDSIDPVKEEESYPRKKKKSSKKAVLSTSGPLLSFLTTSHLTQ